MSPGDHGNAPPITATWTHENILRILSERDALRADLARARGLLERWVDGWRYPVVELMADARAFLAGPTLDEHRTRMEEERMHPSQFAGPSAPAPEDAWCDDCRSYTHRRDCPDARPAPAPRGDCCTDLLGNYIPCRCDGARTAAAPVCTCGNGGESDPDCPARRANEK